MALLDLVLKKPYIAIKQGGSTIGLSPVATVQQTSFGEVVAIYSTCDSFIVGDFVCFYEQANMVKEDSDGYQYYLIDEKKVFGVEVTPP